MIAECDVAENEQSSWSYLFLSHCSRTFICVLWFSRTDSSPERTVSNSKQVKRKAKNPQCGLCNRKFKTSMARDEHQRNHDQVKYRCPAAACGVLFEALQRLRTHCWDNHKGTKVDEQSCRIASSSQDEPSQKRKYQPTMQRLRTHGDVCKHCSRMFKSSRERDGTFQNEIHWQ